MASQRTLSAQADCWSSLRGTGCWWCTEGASLLSIFFFSFRSVFFSKDSTPSLSLQSLSLKLPLKLLSCHSHAPPSFHENITKTREIPLPSIPSEPNSLPQSSRQVLNINHKKRTKIPKPNANQSESAV